MTKWTQKRGVITVPAEISELAFRNCLRLYFLLLIINTFDIRDLKRVE